MFLSCRLFRPAYYIDLLRDSPTTPTPAPFWRTQEFRLYSSLFQSMLAPPTNTHQLQGRLPRHIQMLYYFKRGDSGYCYDAQWKCKRLFKQARDNNEEISYMPFCPHIRKPAFCSIGTYRSVRISDMQRCPEACYATE